STRLGREINTIRQKIDARKKNLQQIDKYADIYIEIAQRAKKLLRSWQGLLNTSQTDSTSITSTPPTNGDTKPRLILKILIQLMERIINEKKTHIIETSVPLQTPALLPFSQFVFDVINDDDGRRISGLRFEDEPGI
ncbi:unnamed protein product, partial [Adineta steineri]